MYRPLPRAMIFSVHVQILCSNGDRIKNINVNVNRVEREKERKIITVVT